jgi:predicted secreted Zn-dependent protease
MASVRTAPAFLVFLVCSGCAGLQPAPPEVVTPPIVKPPVEIVRVETSTSTRFYSVTGKTTGAIFEQILGNGLFEKNGLRAMGLTSGEWGVAWQAFDAGASGGWCNPSSVTVTMHIVVTLPRHQDTDALTEDLRTRWTRFAARVDAHEQRHVDIYLAGANALKSELDALVRRRAPWSSCAAFEGAVRAAWKQQQTSTEDAQRRFHDEEKATLDRDRGPLQAQLDAHKARLAALDGEMRDLAASAEVFSGRIQQARTAMDAANAEIVKSRTACAQARGSGALRAACLRQQATIDAAVAAHNALVHQHNATVNRRNELVDEFNRITVETNTLVDTLNWTQ